MKRLQFGFKQEKQASTLLALASSELGAASSLIEKKLFREAVIHLYFTSFYVSRAILVDKLPANASHENVERQLHLHFGKHAVFPRRYVDLHVFLHRLRNEHSYKTVHSPNPVVVKLKHRVLINYVSFEMKVVPRVELSRRAK